MALCKLCDKESGAKTYCSVRCSRKAQNILSAYSSGRLSSYDYPRAQVSKVLTNAGLRRPNIGVSYD